MGFALVLISTLLPGVANALNSIEEIIVTAQKREQNMQDVGVCVTASLVGNIPSQKLLVGGNHELH